MIELIIIASLILITIIAFAQSSPGYDFVIAEPKPGEYRIFQEKSGVTVYLSWIVISGKTLGINFKMVNNNNYPVTITWVGPQWYSKGIYLASIDQPVEILLEQTDYPVLFKEPGVDNKNIDTIGGSLLGQNCICYDAPEGAWKPSQLTVKLSNLQVTPQNKYQFANTQNI